MSDRYSSSPELRLRIGKSRLRAALYCALCIVTCYALWAIAARGYTMPCLVFSPLAVALLWRLRCDAGAGAQLDWRSGVWTLQHNGLRHVIAPGRRCIVTPWAIYMAYTDLLVGSVGSLWLYADSLSPQQMRQLRVRLTLR